MGQDGGQLQPREYGLGGQLYTVQPMRLSLLSLQKSACSQGAGAQLVCGLTPTAASTH